MKTKLPITGFDVREDIIKYKAFLIHEECSCEKPEWLCFPKAQQCPCGIYAGHVHCKHCGGVISLKGSSRPKSYKPNKKNISSKVKVGVTSFVNKFKTKRDTNQNPLKIKSNKLSLWSRVKDIAFTLAVMYGIIWLVKILFIIIKWILI